MHCQSVREARASSRALFGPRAGSPDPTVRRLQSWRRGVCRRSRGRSLRGRAWPGSLLASTSGSPALCELLVLFPQQITELIVNTVNTVLVVFFLSMIFLGNFLHTAIQFQGPQKTETGKPESGTGWSGLGPTGRVKSTEEKLSRGEDRGLSGPGCQPLPWECEGSGMRAPTLHC